MQPSAAVESESVFSKSLAASPAPVWALGWAAGAPEKVQSLRVRLLFYPFPPALP